MSDQERATKARTTIVDRRVPPPTRPGSGWRPPPPERRRASVLPVLLAVLAIVLSVLLLQALGVFGWLRDRFAGERPATRPLLIATSTPASGAVGPGSTSATPVPTVPALGTVPSPAPPVSARFQSYYDANGGVQTFGLPLSGPLSLNGREVQWFERVRLEHWPERAGTPYEIQSGRLGAEYTQGRDFPDQTYFASRSDLRYFPETRQSLGGGFLSFWQQNGAVRRFGYPISEEFDEVLADGATYRVQYFERARLEWHPERAGTPDEVMIGLLGRALFFNERRADTVPPAPTPVPLP